MIDAHVHLWEKQQGRVNGLPVYDLGGGKSMFGAEVRQMLPPYMTDGVNSAERLLASMDFAQVAGAVVTQEYIDGSQDGYLRRVREKYPVRFRVAALYEEKELPEDLSGFDGIKLCGGRLEDADLTKHEAPFARAAAEDKFIVIFIHIDFIEMIGLQIHSADRFADARNAALQRFFFQIHVFSLLSRLYGGACLFLYLIPKSAERQGLFPFLHPPEL